jgi:hypothetical protein
VQLADAALRPSAWKLLPIRRGSRQAFGGQDGSATRPCVAACPAARRQSTRASSAAIRNGGGLGVVTVTVVWVALGGSSRWPRNRGVAAPSRSPCCRPPRGPHVPPNSTDGTSRRGPSPSVRAGAYVVPSMRAALGHHRGRTRSPAPRFRQNHHTHPIAARNERTHLPPSACVLFAVQGRRDECV